MLALVALGLCALTDDAVAHVVQVPSSSAGLTSLSGTGRQSQQEDDRPAPVSADFGAALHTVREGETVEVAVRLSRPPGRELKLDLTVTRGDDVTDADYVLEPESLTFEGTDTRKTFIVRAREDTDVEDAETIVVGFGSSEPADHVTAGTPATVAVTLTDVPSASAIDVLRARFTGGAVFFGGSPRIVPSEDGMSAGFESPQFGHASPYLAFEVQPRVWPSVHQGRDMDYRPVSFEPFASVRLTTIAVAGAESSQAASKEIQVPGVSFLQSQKTPQVQVGSVLSYNFGGFGTSGMRFHWGLGLVHRTVFQSVTDAQRALRIWNIDDDLYDAHALGLRLALYEKSHTARSWLPAAYVDVSVGWFQNFELVSGHTDRATSCLSMPFQCLEDRVPEAEFHPVKKPRLYIEGRLFVRAMYLGFDLNNGDGYDDLRFSAGMTFKLETLFSRSEQ